jgi:hypothetical protein
LRAADDGDRVGVAFGARAQEGGEGLAAPMPGRAIAGGDILGPDLSEGEQGEDPFRRGAAGQRRV